MEEPALEMVAKLMDTIDVTGYGIIEDVITVSGYSISEDEILESVPEPVSLPESAHTDELADLQSRFICLQYEYLYNLDKISDLDYEHRYKNSDYPTYQFNVGRILQKSSYINQWTSKLSKCGLFQKDLKKMYKEQIETASAAVKRIEEEKKRILSKATLQEMFSEN